MKELSREQCVQIAGGHPGTVLDGAQWTVGTVLDVIGSIRNAIRLHSWLDDEPAGRFGRAFP